MRGGGLVYAVAILLFIGYLAVTAQCRFDAGTRSSYLEDHAAGAATMVNTTSSLDESKLSIKFCIKAGCSHADGLWKTCFCCDILPDKSASVRRMSAGTNAPPVTLSVPCFFHGTARINK
ncbi:hypothetical protein ZWY2020_026027 [Hordeum vulgare]|nr:hypothetical protein ZWY2020_026027 [Hordeum vulgare]